MLKQQNEMKEEILDLKNQNDVQNSITTELTHGLEASGNRT